MRLIKQKIELPINNVEINQNTNKTFRKHSLLLPNNIRCIICGPSGVGKTNVIINLLEIPNGLRFENVYIYSKSLFQPKYIYLQKLLSKIKGMSCFLFTSNDDIIPFDQVKPNSVFIFDDVICGKQNNIRSYFCMGRHKGIDLSI